MYFQQGGQQAQIMQIIQQYAQLNQIDPKQLLDQFKQLPAEQQQQALQQMVQTLQQGAAEQQPDMAQAAMAYGGYTTGIFAGGGEMIRRADGSYSKRGLWDNIRANKGSGKKPTKEMLKQERKIRAEEAAYGGVYGEGGTNNAGFQALPEYVQAKILSNMGYGGHYNPMTMMDDGGETNAGMAMGQIAAMHDKLSRLQKFINGPEAEVDPWVASKITLADDYLTTVADYMQYGEQQEPENEMPGASYKGGGSTFSGNAFYQSGGQSIIVNDPNDPRLAAYNDSLYKYNSSNRFNNFLDRYQTGVDDVDKSLNKYSTLKRANKELSTNKAINKVPYFVPHGGGSPIINGEYNIFKKPTQQVIYLPAPNMAYGGIHINPANKGKFTASAKRAGMGVQEFASHVLANKDDYSSTQVKRANFARNAAGWKKQMGGLTEGDILDVTPEQLQMLQQGGYNFEIID